jgi:hypothetical protein
LGDVGSSSEQPKRRRTATAQDTVALIHGKHGGARMETSYVNPGRHFKNGMPSLFPKRFDTVVSRRWILLIPRLLTPVGANVSPVCGDSEEIEYHFS